YGHRVRCARLARASLVDAHLHAFHLRLRVHPERPFDPTEIFESEAEGSRVRLLREAHHSIAALFLQAHDELHASIELALAARARRDQKQPIAVFARQYVRNHLETVNGRRIAAARVRSHHALECAQFLTQARVILLERADLLGELLLSGALDGEPAVGGIRHGAQPFELRARVVELAADPAELRLHFAAVKPGEAPARVVDPECGKIRNAEQHGDSQPAPVPGKRAVNFYTRRGDTEAAPQVLGPALQGTTATCVSPAVSGKPNIRFMFCTAWPDAPFTRLSMTDSTTSVSDPLALCGGRCTAIRHRFAARTERVSGWLPAGITSTNGSRP